MTKAAQFTTAAISSGPFQGGHITKAESVQPHQWQRRASPDTGQNGRTRTKAGHVRTCPAGNRWAGHRTDTDRGLKTCPSVRSAHAPDMQTSGGEGRKGNHGSPMTATGPSRGHGVRGARSLDVFPCMEKLKSKTRLPLWAAD